MACELCVFYPKNGFCTKSMSNLSLRFEICAYFEWRKKDEKEKSAEEAERMQGYESQGGV